MNTNRISIDDLQNYRCAYIIGIGGVSMSSLAMILKERGLSVRGYDRSVTDVTIHLQNEGIRIWYADDPAAFDGVDLVCYTAAVDAEHPQMILAKESGARIISRAELLGCIAASYQNSVAVAGTHGKSTTSGMLSHLFLKNPRFDPTVVVGAKMNEINSTYRIGKDENFIFEACEYKDSFLSFFPKTAIVLNIQLDHTDYFHSIEQMINSFVRFMNNAGQDGVRVVNRDCENCMTAARMCQGTVITFSADGNTEATYYAENVDLSDGYGAFDVYCKGSYLLHAKLGVPGKHNVSNALAAIAVAVQSGLSSDEITQALATFHGVNRRFEFLCEKNGAKYYDDYAHHPDEIRATLAVAKTITKGRVICVFQPHNYSRLHDLFHDFCSCFDDADLLVLTKLYAAREAAGAEVTSELLAEKTGAVYIDSLEDIPVYLDSVAENNDTVLLMGAGTIGIIAENFKKSEKIS